MTGVLAVELLFHQRHWEKTTFPSPVQLKVSAERANKNLQIAAKLGAQSICEQSITRCL